MKKISDFYYGKPASENSTNSESAYHKLMEECVKLSQEFESRLSDDDFKLYQQLSEMQTRLSAITVTENYIQGFRDGAGIMIDVMLGKNESPL